MKEKIKNVYGATQKEVTTTLVGFRDELHLTTRGKLILLALGVFLIAVTIGMLPMSGQTTVTACLIIVFGMYLLSRALPVIFDVALAFFGGLFRLFDQIILGTIRAFFSLFSKKSA